MLHYCKLAVICLAVNIVKCEFHNNVFDGHVNVVKRNRRSLFAFSDTPACDTTNLPQPTAKYPAILFENENYNNCLNNGSYMRLSTDRFYRWGKNSEGRQRFRILKWKSMLALQNSNLTFRACCPSGNNFLSTTSDWNSTSDMNATVYQHPKLSGTDGIWYFNWLHWPMDFDVKVNTPIGTIPTCTSTCFNGDCGLSGKCECLPGYSGDQCEIAPALSDKYPNQTTPMVLFKDYDFQGDHSFHNADTYVKFASNKDNVRIMEYKSVRFLFDRPVSFSRNLDYQIQWDRSSNIRNISEFMLSNVEIADPLWYNYERMYDVEFNIKFVGNTACDNCTVAQGSCYTGTCVCFDGFTGNDCENSI